MAKLAYKIFDSKGRIIFAVVIILLFEASLLSINSAYQADPYSSGAYANMYSSGQYFWHTVSWLGSRFVIMLAVLYMIIVAPQYSFLAEFNTPGYRNELWRTNFLLVFVFASAWVFLLLVSGFVYLLVAGDGQWPFFRIYYLVIVWIDIAGILLMAFIAASIARSTVGAIVVFGGYFLFEALVRKYISLSGASIELFLPARIFTRLVPPPSPDFGNEDILKKFLEQNPVPVWTNTVIALVYILFFSIASRKLTIKKNRNHEKKPLNTGDAHAAVASNSSTDTKVDQTT